MNTEEGEKTFKKTKTALALEREIKTHKLISKHWGVFPNKAKKPQKPQTQEQKGQPAPPPPKGKKGPQKKNQQNQKKRNRRTKQQNHKINKQAHQPKSKLLSN